MNNSVFVVYSKSDADYVQRVESDMVRQEMILDFSLDGNDEVLEKRIDECVAVLLLTTDNFRKDIKVKQLVKYAHDLNKTFIVMGDHSGGMFNRQSWVNNEMDVSATVYGYKDAEQFGEVLAMLRSSMGVEVAMGDRIGCLISFNFDAPCCVYADSTKLFDVETPGSYQYRLKSGEYTLKVVSKRIERVVDSRRIGVLLSETPIVARTNGFFSLDGNIKLLENDYLTKAISEENKNLQSIEKQLVSTESSLVKSRNTLKEVERRLQEPKPTVPYVETSTGKKVGYALLFAIIGSFFFGFGAIIGLFLGPWLAEHDTEKGRQLLLEKLTKEYNDRMQKYRDQRQELLVGVKKKESQIAPLITKKQSVLDYIESLKALQQSV